MCGSLLYKHCERKDNYYWNKNNISVECYVIFRENCGRTFLWQKKKNPTKLNIGVKFSLSGVLHL